MLLNLTELLIAALMTDRLTLARALENGGIAHDAAEHITAEMFDAIHDNVATKADLREAEQRLQGGITEVKVEIEKVHSELKIEIEKVQSELKIEIERVRSELIKWVVGVGFAQVAMLLAVTRIFPGMHP